MSSALETGHLDLMFQEKGIVIAAAYVSWWPHSLSEHGLILPCNSDVLQYGRKPADLTYSWILCFSYRSFPYIQYINQQNFRVFYDLCFIVFYLECIVG
jgi:hypothetical protein